MYDGVRPLGLDHHFLTILRANVQDDMVRVRICTKKLDVARLTVLVSDNTSMGIFDLSFRTAAFRIVKSLA